MKEQSSYIICNDRLQMNGGEAETKWKILKRAEILALTVSTCMICTYPVSASDDQITEEAVEEHSEDTYYSLLRGSNLNFGAAEITKVASNKINVYGLTQCHHECGTVYLDMDLERKVNGSYSTYESWEFTANDVNHLSKSIDVLVPSGYYYRIRGYHAAKDDGLKESGTTLTKRILVQ